MKVGLVLSGGAAKGAYHVGILKALHLHDIEVDIYSGASIGALNAVLAASSSNIGEAATRLDAIWNDLAINSPLKLNDKTAYLAVCRAFAALAASYPHPIAKQAGIAASFILKKMDDNESGLIDAQPIIDKFHKYVDLTKKAQWKDIWVSTFEGTGYQAIIEFVKNELGIDGKTASYHELKALPDDVLLETVMASAALPLLYQTRTIDGKTHYDGGVRDNTPVEKLIGRCDVCFVSHLSNGSSFSRYDFDQSKTQIIEIRPSDKFVTELDGSSSIKAMMNFSKEKIDYLINMGFKDANSVLTKLKESDALESQLSRESENLEQLLQQL